MLQDIFWGSFLGLMPDSLSRTMHKQANAAKFKKTERTVTYRLMKKQSEKMKCVIGA